MNSVKQLKKDSNKPNLYENVAQISKGPKHAYALDTVIEEALEYSETGSAVQGKTPVPAILAPKPKRFSMDVQEGHTPLNEESQIIVVEAPELYSTAAEGHSASQTTSLPDDHRTAVQSVQLR